MEYYETKKLGSSWINKYAPKDESEIIGNLSEIKLLKQWLTAFDANKKISMQNIGKKKTKLKLDIIEDEQFDGEPGDDESYEINEEKTTTMLQQKKTMKPKSCAIITGNHGVGKTCIVQTILTTMGYTIQTINFSKIKSTKNIKEVMENILNCKDIYSLIKEEKKGKIAILIDELESITSNTGKSCVSTLLKNNDIHWFYPVIFISNNQHNKLLTAIKKNSYEIKIKPPWESQMMILLKKISNMEKINFENHYAGYPIAEHAQRDYRRLILLLMDVKYVCGESLITKKNAIDFCNSAKKKDDDYDLFKATKFLLSNYNGIDESVRYYETEKVLLPLMVHQNYIDIIGNKCNDNTDEEKKYKLAEEIAGMLSEGDIIENYIYGEQNWDIHDVHGFYTCIAPSYLLGNNLNNEPINKLTFPADLNKSSIGKINRKNIINANKCFKNKNIHDYIYINLIIRNLIYENKMEECIKMLSKYNIKLSHIESLLKVDKIKSSKTNLSSKQRKELSILINE